MNVAVVRGRVTRAPELRRGTGAVEVMSFDLATEGDFVPVVCDPKDAPGVGGDDEVVAVGRVRRRFFRVGGSTQSRTELVASTVLPARRRRQVERVLARAAEEVMAGGG